MARVVDAVAAAVVEAGWTPSADRDGLVDFVRTDDRAQRIVQVQVSPPGARRRTPRLPGGAPPMATVNLQLDHVAVATAFGRELGSWPLPIDQRLGILTHGWDAWWVLGEPVLGAAALASRDAEQLGAHLAAAVVEVGMPFLEDMADPVRAHASGRVLRPVPAAELAWVAGDTAAARARLAAAEADLADLLGRPQDALAPVQRTAVHRFEQARAVIDGGA